jgi:hypothetical protein
MVVLLGIAVYGLIGLIVAVAFVLFGLARVLPYSATVTVGARLLFIPGAAALWPYVLIRWLTFRGVP